MVVQPTPQELKYHHPTKSIFAKKRWHTGWIIRIFNIRALDAQTNHIDPLSLSFSLRKMLQSTQSKADLDYRGSFCLDLHKMGLTNNFKKKSALPQPAQTNVPQSQTYRLKTLLWKMSLIFYIQEVSYRQPSRLTNQITVHRITESVVSVQTSKNLVE